MDDRPLSFGRTATIATRPSIELAGALLLLAVAGTVFRYAVFYLATGQASFELFVETLCRNDCDWYRDIVADGYGEAGTAEVVNRAFFPLYPALVWGLHRLTGLSIAASGFLCSTVFTLIAAWAARGWFGAQRDAWRLFAFTLFFGPFSFLLSILYTESLFILLSLVALNAINRSRWVEAGLWVALLSLTRVTGVLMGLAILAGFVAAHVRAGDTLRSLLPAALRQPRLLLSLALAPLGLLAYMLYLHFAAGDALLFLHAQSHWNRHLQSPLATLLTAVTNLWPADPLQLTDVAAHWAILIGIVLTIVLARRGRLPEAVFCGAVILVSMAAGSGSMLRFTAGLVPIGMLVCELLASRRALYLAAYPVSALLGGLALLSWLNGWTLLV